MVLTIVVLISECFQLPCASVTQSWVPLVRLQLLAELVPLTAPFEQLRGDQNKLLALPYVCLQVASHCAFVHAVSMPGNTLSSALHPSTPDVFIRTFPARNIFSSVFLFNLLCSVGGPLQGNQLVS